MGTCQSAAGPDLTILLEISTNPDNYTASLFELSAAEKTSYSRYVGRERPMACVRFRLLLATFVATCIARTARSDIVSTVVSGVGKHSALSYRLYIIWLLFLRGFTHLRGNRFHFK